MPSLGVGYCPESPIPYDDDYWEMYRRYDATDLSYDLTRSRISLVENHLPYPSQHARVDCPLPRSKTMVDVGIGGGAFVSAMDCYGYDINPRACRWLHDQRRYVDPYTVIPDCLTFWDSLEHMPDPGGLLSRVAHWGWVFLSIPIFLGPEHVLESKHYKPGEHIWYFTKEGLLYFMEQSGFTCKAMDYRESLLGREDIMSFAFYKNLTTDARWESWLSYPQSIDSSSST